MRGDPPGRPGCDAAPMTFGEVLGLIVVSFVLFAFLGTLLMITRDLLTNPAFSGAVKATWLVLFLFLPVLSVIGYVVVNGRGMTDRAADREPRSGRRQPA
jgi:hypothetical protein